MRAIYIRVGLLLLIGLAAGIGVVLFLSGGSVRDGWKFESYFRESVQGLDVGSSVKLRGVTVGQVSEIALVSAAYPDAMPDDVNDPRYRMVLVRLAVDPGKAGRLPRFDQLAASGLRARVATQGITGLAYIELDFVDPAKFPADQVPWRMRDAYLPSMPSTISRVQDAAQELAAKLQTVDFAKLSAAAQLVLDDLHTQLTAADMPAVAAELRATAAAIRALADGKPTQDMLLAATRAADQVGATVARLQPLLAALAMTMRKVDDGVGDLQHDLGPALRDARAAMANLRETSETLRRYPASVLLGAPPPAAVGR